MTYKVYATVQYTEVFCVEAETKKEAEYKVMNGDCDISEKIYDDQIVDIERIEESCE